MGKESVYFTTKMIENNGWIEFYAEYEEVLMHINKTTGEMKCVYIPDNGHYRSCARCGSDYLLFPCGKGDICVYDETKYSASYIKKPLDVHKKNENNWSANYTQFDKKLYFYWFDSVVTEYDIVDQRWRTYRDWIEKIPSGITGQLSFVKNAFRINENIYFLIQNANMLLEINTLNGNQSLIQMELDSDETTTCMYYNSRKLYLLTRKKESIVVRTIDDIYNKQSKKLCEIPVYTTETSPFYGFFVSNSGDVIIFPQKYDKVYRINEDGKYTDITEEMPVCKLSDLSIGNYPYNYVCDLYTDRFYYTINIQTGDLISVDRVDACFECKKIYLSGHEKKKLVDRMSKRGCLNEGEFIELEDYLVALCESK